ncbi:MAG: protein phosphatase 2C domain-containing protein [Verrucomicrobiota bacterium]
METTAYGITDRGLVRQKNEDALFINEAHKVFAVADGLGGLPGGADASQRIVELLKQTYQSVDSVEEYVNLAQLIVGINKIISQESSSKHPLTGSGSTLTIGQVVERQLMLAHVGDSALYHLRNGELKKLTIDHTMEQEVIDRMGESARSSIPPEYPHTLTRCVGQEHELLVDQTRIQLQAGDRLLLCTDGLNKVLPIEHIQEALAAETDPKAICENLVQQANANHGPDNITIITVLIR